MKQFSRYVAMKIHENTIDSLANQMNESVDDFKYKVDELKEKWNKFWGWVFGDSSDSQYSMFSDEYDDEIFKADIIDNYDCMSDEEKNKSKDISWIVVNNSVDSNKKNVKKLVNDSSIEKKTGFWRTSKLMNDENISFDDCKFVLCWVKIEIEDNFAENTAAILVIKDSNVILVDLLEIYDTVVTWTDIYKYITSNKFTKDVIKTNEFTIVIPAKYSDDSQVKKTFGNSEKLNDKDLLKYKISKK